MIGQCYSRCTRFVRLAVAYTVNLVINIICFQGDSNSDLWNRNCHYDHCASDNYAGYEAPHAATLGNKSE